jgi:hypothetical protein
MISYRKILKQAWTITKTNRFLWWYGLLLFFGMSLNVWYGAYRPNSPVDSEQLRIALVDSLLDKPWGMTLVVILVGAWLMIYFRAKAGMLLSIKMITERQPASFLLTFGIARNFMSRLVGIWVVLQGVMIVLGAVITTPIFYLFYIGQAGKGGILALLGLLVFLPIAFVISFINTLGPLFLVLFNMPVLQGIRAAVDAISQAWKKLLLFTLILSIISVLASILALAAAAPFVILTVLSYHSGGYSWVVIPSTLVAVAIFLGCQAVISTFHQTSWTLFFLELIGPEKIEEETVSVPDSAT